MADGGRSLDAWIDANQDVIKSELLVLISGLQQILKITSAN